jgi:predicted nucleic acid-binding protein
MLLKETEGYWTQFIKIIETGRIVGGQIHDARIAALCQLHEVRELWTADRDFSRFSGISVRNRLIK